MIEVFFDEKAGIIETSFSAIVELDEILSYINKTEENKNYPRKLKIMTDASKATFNFSVDDIGAIIEANNKSLKKYDSIIDAIVVSDPKNTAISLLFKELGQNSKYKFEVFSTVYSARKWLNNIE